MNLRKINSRQPAKYMVWYMVEQQEPASGTWLHKSWGKQLIKLMTRWEFHSRTLTLAMPLTNGQTFRVFVSKCFCHSACQLKSTDIALCIAFLFRTLMSSNLQHLKTFDMCLVWVKNQRTALVCCPKGLLDEMFIVMLKIETGNRNGWE